MNVICTRSATELAGLIARRELSSREVVQAHLDRIEDVNGRVGAITRVLRDTALAAADQADRSPPVGPLHGVPFTVKENLDCLGSPTTHGIPALRDALPWVDAPVVARMKAAGAIPIGRTNLPEWSLRFCTDNPLHGPTLNPWDRRVTPGGSSGGDAAALATGMTPFGLGNDLGGSLRNPSYCCGIAALKPTSGRIARAGSIPPLDFGFALQAFAVEGPMARTVDDLELGLSVLAGRDVRDPRSVDVPLRGPAAPRRAALWLPNDASPALLADLRRVGGLLAEAGWEVRLASPPSHDLVTETWLDLVAIDLAALLPDMRPLLSRPTYEYVAGLCAISEARDVPNSELHARRSSLARQWSEFFARHPVLVSPTWACPPWPVDADLAPDDGLALVLDTAHYVLPANLLGFPAIALPTGVANGLPTGVQLSADLWREDLCLEAAKVIERGVTRPTPIEPRA